MTPAAIRQGKTSPDKAGPGLTHPGPGTIFRPCFCPKQDFLLFLTAKSQ